MAQRARHQTRRPQQVKPQAALQLRQEVLQATPPNRERLLPPQRLSTHRNPIRQAGKKLPCFRLPRRSYRVVDFMSLDPRRMAKAVNHSGPSSHITEQRLANWEEFQQFAAAFED